MRLSAKARYGLAAMMMLAAQYDGQEVVTVNHIAQELSISKIYLEQVFAQLRSAGLVTSQKGSQGGYRLSLPPVSISIYDVLATIDHSLFEPAGDTVAGSALHVEKAMQELVFQVLDDGVRAALSGISLETVAARAIDMRQGGYMYYL